MIVDILVIAVMLISAAISFLRGFIRETLTILGVVGGAFASYLGGPLALPVVEGWLGIEEGAEPQRLFDVIPYTLLADILTYGGIFIVVVVVLSFISHIMAEAVRSLGLGAVDRTLGVVFGLVRGLVVLGLLYLPFHLILDKEQKIAWFGGSKTHFYLEQTAEVMAGYLPEDAEETAKEGAKGAAEAISTREKLQSIDLLQKEGEDKAAESPVGEENPDDGYTDEFRNKMDELFQEETQRPTAGNE